MKTRKIRTMLAVAAAVLLEGGLAAQTKMPAVSDAQVESSVLKALSVAPKLAEQQITTTTVYGEVTLTGSVPDEATRSLAEDVVSRTPGVKKVIDELTLGSSTGVSAANTSAPTQNSTPTLNSNADQPSPLVLQSDGSYAPADSAPAQGDAQSSSQGTEAGGAYGQVASQGSPQRLPRSDEQSSPAPVQRTAPGSPAYSSGPNQSGAPGRADSSYYGAPPTSPYGRTPYPAGRSPYQGQIGGAPVTVPAGSVMEVRLSQALDSRRVQPGQTFTATVARDVVAGGFIAIPRGANVEGIVADATQTGALKGHTSLALRLTQVTLGGRTYPLSSDTWSQEKGSKAQRTVNSALGLGAVGAIIGGVAGGGAGAAIGAGVGGAAGVGASAASQGPVAYLPPESVIQFQLTAPVDLTTVSQAELDRLGYGARPAMYRRLGPPPPPPYPYYYRPYGGYYYAPRPYFYRPY